MIRINLLPHREEAKKARKQQFFVFAAIAVSAALLIVFAVYSVIASNISDQEARNDFLKREIAVLDKQLDQIKRLKEQSQSLLARKQVIENLQRDRGDTVHLLSELVTQVPEGVYLKTLKQEGTSIAIAGYAQSNARISALMRNLEASPWLERPQLVESKAVMIGSRRVNEFSMNFRVTRLAPADEGKGKK